MLDQRRHRLDLVAAPAVRPPATVFHRRLGVNRGTLTADVAKSMARSAVWSAEKAGVVIAVVICDHAGQIVAQKRMSDLSSGDLEIADAKAFTACSFDIETRSLARDGLSCSDLFDHRLGARQMIFSGGIPVHADGAVIGAVGVSGGSDSENHACAQAAERAYDLSRS